MDYLLCKIYLINIRFSYLICLWCSVFLVYFLGGGGSQLVFQLFYRPLLFILHSQITFLKAFYSIRLTFYYSSRFSSFITLDRWLVAVQLAPCGVLLPGWRSKDEIVSDVLLWTPAYGQSKARRPARTFIQQLCDDTGCNPEDLPKVMNDRETWRERVRDIRASRTSWRWWWWLH